MATLLTALAAASSLIDADIFPVVTNVATVPDGKKATIATLFTSRTHTGTLTLDNNTATASAIDIDGPVNTTVPVIQCNDADALTTAGFFNFASDSVSTGTRSLGVITNNSTLAVNTTVCTLTQNADERCLRIDVNANGSAIRIETLATTANVVDIPASASTSGSIFRAVASSLTTGRMLDLLSNSTDVSTRTLGNIHNTNTASVGTTCLTLIQDSTQRALLVDMNGVTGNAIAIDQDSNDAGDVYAISITSDNAGAGKGAGIDFSTFSVDEPNLKFTADAATTAGAVVNRIAVDIGGTLQYIFTYAHGS